ncbi:MAG: hypothetical protein AVDCRST_MAG68-1206, partial [uncultured Gemmatimonadetes bacterium]
ERRRHRHRAAGIRALQGAPDRALSRDQAVVPTGEEEEDASPGCVRLPFPRGVSTPGGGGAQAQAHHRGAQPGAPAHPRDRAHGASSGAAQLRGGFGRTGPCPPGSVRRLLLPASGRARHPGGGTVLARAM